MASYLREYQSCCHPTKGLDETFLVLGRRVLDNRYLLSPSTVRSCQEEKVITMDEGKHTWRRKMLTGSPLRVAWSSHTQNSEERREHGEEGIGARADTFPFWPLT